jgi:hypothetical protein
VFVAASLHATPGSGRIDSVRVKEWKPFFHGAVAIELSRLSDPFLFAIDANEPRLETLDLVQFHWANRRPGVMKFAALLGLEPRHRARDLFREDLMHSGKPAGTSDYLALTYTTVGGGGRHFDHLWATPDFALDALSVHYEDALMAGTDHALVVTDLSLHL